MTLTQPLDKMQATLYKSARPVHILCAVYNFAFVYTPLHHWQYGMAVVQWVSLPMLLVTGFMIMHFKKFFAKKRAKQNSTQSYSVSLSSESNEARL